MKRIFPVLVAVMILVSSLAFAVPARADDIGVLSGKYELNYDFSGFTDLLEYSNEFYQNVNVTYNDVLYAQIEFSQTKMYLIPPEGSTKTEIFYRSGPAEWTWSVDSPVVFDFGAPQEVDPVFFAMFLSIAVQIEPYNPTQPAPYYAVYTLLGNGIYGSVEELTGEQVLVLTTLATCSCVFMVVLPFLIVWLIICKVTGG